MDAAAWPHLARFFPDEFEPLERAGKQPLRRP